MYFCPSCANLLLIAQGETGQNEFVCQTCPYVCKITKAGRVESKKHTYVVVFLTSNETTTTLRIKILEQPITSKTTYKRKEVDDVLGGSAAWENVDSTDGNVIFCNQHVSLHKNPYLPSPAVARCPKCEHGRAYFMQLQIRSADEPMSIFYKVCGAFTDRIILMAHIYLIMSQCCKCAEQWREG